MFRIGWVHAEAKLIDRKFVQRSLSDRERQIFYEVWDYMVELTGQDSDHTRLVIREKPFRLDLPTMGGVVPILVNKARTKAAFDLKDPTIGTGASQMAKADARKREEAVRRHKDEARFKGRLRNPDE